MLTGRVFVDGRPFRGARVLLLSGDASKVLGGTVTDDAGRFEFPLEHADDQDRRHLLVKLQGPILAVSHRVVDLDSANPEPVEVRIESDGPEFHRLHAQVDATVEAVPPIRLFITPLNMTGIPPEIERFFLRQSERVVEDAFYTQRLEAPSLELTVQDGTYRIGGESLSKAGPLAGGMPANYAIVGMTINGESEPAPGDRISGFLVQVDRDREITLTVEEVPPASS
jgi:hypothetical protein